MSTDTLPAEADFADVYAANLDAVWRFVRARIWDHHEAQDVTSEVFMRAWRSWDRFDPDRGPVEPWLFTIAHRSVTDRLRHRRPDLPVDPASLSEAGSTLSPEQQVLREELLAQLAHALEGLRPDARDGLALRFAARLSTRHIAEVLGTSISAVKMLLHRAVHQLADQVEMSAPDGQEPADQEVADSSASSTSRDTPASAGTARSGGWVATLLSVSGVCLACTVPALATVFTALGIVAAGAAIHWVGLAAVPVVLWLVHRGGRRHGHDRGYRWARAGAILMAVHALLHVFVETGTTLPDWMWVGTPWVVTDWTGTIPGVGQPEWVWTLFAITDWAGTPLLVLGASVNLVDMHRWRQAQARGVRQLQGT